MNELFFFFSTAALICGGVISIMAWVVLSEELKRATDRCEQKRLAQQMREANGG